MKKKIFWPILLGILFVSLFIRSLNLLSNPPSLFSDEVDAGYQAYVFNACGNDYFGHKTPTHFQSFADWRTPLYLYSIAITQKLIGNTELAVRLPSMIFGFASTIVFFLLIKKIYKNKWLALLGLVLFSFNPLFFHYGRAAWEVTGMILCLLLAIYLWICYLDKPKIKYLCSSIIFLAGTFYFYATSKLFIIFLIFSLFCTWFKDILRLNRKHLVIGVLVGILVSLPMLVDTLSGRAGFRFSYINIFSDPTNVPTVNLTRSQDAAVDHPGQIGVAPTKMSVLIHNKATLLLSKFVRNYFSSFSTDYLFLTGDGHLRQGFGTKGNYYYPDLFFLIIGIGVVISKILRGFKILDTDKRQTKAEQFMLLLLIFAPIPFSLTRDSTFPQSTRLILMVPSMIYFIYLGMVESFRYLLRINRLLFSGIAILVVVIHLSLFTDFYYYYYHRYPQISARQWHYGMKKAVLDSIALKDKYQKIYYSSTYEPFIPFFYYYSRYLPTNGSCAPAVATTHYEDKYFNGLQIENKYFLGNTDWDVYISEQYDQAVHNLYVIPESELLKFKDAVGKDSHNLRVVILSSETKKFDSQELIYLVALESKR